MAAAVVFARADGAGEIIPDPGLCRSTDPGCGSKSPDPGGGLVLNPGHSERCRTRKRGLRASVRDHIVKNRVDSRKPVLSRPIPKSRNRARKYTD